MENNIVITKLRGIPINEYKAAFQGGATAYRNIAEEPDPERGSWIDIKWDAYISKKGIDHNDPHAQAWMDGWVNADSTADEFLNAAS